MISSLTHVILPPPGKANYYLLKQGMRVDGSKAARELGISYTPIRMALEEMLTPLRSSRSV